MAKTQGLADEKETSAFLYVSSLLSAACIPKVLKTVIELDVLEIMVGAGQGAQLAASEIASKLPTMNPEASVVLDRMLRFLASHSVLTCTAAAGDDGRTMRLYGLAPVCRFLTRGQDGASMATLLLVNQDPVFQETWEPLKYAVLEGEVPFTKVHGMSVFEYQSTNTRFNKVFNEGMSNFSNNIVKKITESYRGFEGIKELIDVGGGLGATLNMIISMYPHIKGINFDLPHVIHNARPIPGVEHVEGDMFVGIPTGSTIFMKGILHNWNDENCLKILKNCWKALLDGGKVIVIEQILPETMETNDKAKIAFYMDLCMLTYNDGAKERTENEFKSLAMEARFSEFKVVVCAFNVWVMEFTK